MRKHITTGIRVSARRGEKLPKEPGQQRSKRQVWFGNVTESVGEGSWKVTWDNGQISIERSNGLQVQPASAGRLPVLPASPYDQPPPQPRRSEDCGSVGEHGGPQPAPHGAEPPTAPSPSTGTTSGSSTGAWVPPAAPGLPSSTPNGPVTTTPASIEIATQDPDQAEEEDLGADESDDDDEDESPDVHEAARIAAKATLEAQIGTTVSRSKDGVSAIWTVVSPTTSPFPSTARVDETKFGLIDGLPLIQGEPDLLAVWLRMYPGDMETHVLAMNDAGLRSNGQFQPITEHEYVRFWGMVIAARQFSEKGKNLWSDDDCDGVRSIPNFDTFMSEHRFCAIRRLIPKICSGSAIDPWLRFRPMIEAFNENRKRTVHSDGDATADESMSAWQPRLDKFGGLPNLSFIKRKPKPLGTEFKTVCDTKTGVMRFMEIQEGKEAMRALPLAREMGVTAACTLRLAESCAPGATLLGDSWFGSVKVCLMHVCLPDRVSDE